MVNTLDMGADLIWEIKDKSIDAHFSKLLYL